MNENGLNRFIDTIVDLVDVRLSKKTKAKVTQATVLRLDGDTVWVHAPGGADETPCVKTIECKPGDTIQCRINGGKGVILGNQTSPPTDDTKANKVGAAEKKTEKRVTIVEQVAEELKKTTKGIMQYFWFKDGDDSEAGAHVTEVPRDEFEDNPSGGNLLLRSSLIKLRQGLITLAEFLATGFKVYKGSYPILQATYSGTNNASQRAYWNAIVDATNTTASKTITLKVNQSSIYAVYVKCRTYGPSGSVLYEENLSVPGITAMGSPTFEGVASLTYTSTDSTVTITATHNSSYPDHYVEMLNVDIIYDATVDYPKILCGYRPDYDGGVFGIADGSDGNVFDVDYEGNVMTDGVIDAAGLRMYGMLPLKVINAVKDNYTLSAGDGATVSVPVTIPTGYTPIGIVGFSVSNATSGGTLSSNVYVRGLYLSGSTPYIKVESRTASGGTASKIKIEMRVLCTSMQ